jgi:Fe-S cluster biogenesis protein NfuA
MSADTVTNEAIQPAASEISREKVLEVLELVRPYLQGDGGDVELVNITADNIVQLRLQGACGTCPSSTYTLKLGIEEQLRQHIPAVQGVEAVM